MGIGWSRQREKEVRELNEKRGGQREPRETVNTGSRMKTKLLQDFLDSSS